MISGYFSATPADSESSPRVLAENDATRIKHQLQVANERLAEAPKEQDGLKQQVHTKATELDSLRKKVEQLEATAQANAYQ